ncbi:MAG: plastocyanin/azurin family copper-binding protein [Gemmatimonas sp.]
MIPPIAKRMPGIPASSRAVDQRLVSKRYDAPKSTVHVVRMLGDEQGYRFEPANLTVQQGDSVRFLLVSGGPHNVAFDSTAIPAGATERLAATMPAQIAPLMGAMLLNAGETYTLSFDGMPPGAYPYQCTPHLAMNQRGIITVR